MSQNLIIKLTKEGKEFCSVYYEHAGYTVPALVRVKELLEGLEYELDDVYSASSSELFEAVVNYTVRQDGFVYKEDEDLLGFLFPKIKTKTEGTETQGIVAFIDDSVKTFSRLSTIDIEMDFDKKNIKFEDAYMYLELNDIREDWTNESEYKHILSLIDAGDEKLKGFDKGKLFRIDMDDIEDTERALDDISDAGGYFRSTEDENDIFQLVEW